MKAFKVEQQPHFSPLQVVIEVQSVDELRAIWREYRRFCASSAAGYPSLSANWQLLEAVYKSLVDDMKRFVPRFKPCARELSQEGEEIADRRATKTRPRLVGGAV